MELLNSAMMNKLLFLVAILVATLLSVTKAASMEDSLAPAQASLAPVDDTLIIEHGSVADQVVSSVAAARFLPGKDDRLEARDDDLQAYLYAKEGCPDPPENEKHFHEWHGPDNQNLHPPFSNVWSFKPLKRDWWAHNDVNCQNNGNYAKATKGDCFQFNNDHNKYTTINCIVPA